MLIIRYNNTLELCKESSVNDPLLKKQQDIEEFLKEIYEVEKKTGFSQADNSGEFPFLFNYNQLKTQTLRNSIHSVWIRNTNVDN